MVAIDWKTFMGIKPDSLTEREKDDLYDTVTWYNPDFNLDRKYLLHFVRVIQEVLKYKAEQVDLLTNELDDLAAKEGKEEGSKLQPYIEEIEQLKEELEYHKKLDKNSSRSPYASSEELKRDIVRLEMQNEELLNELSEKEKELLNEKEEVERYAAQVATLEREKQELSRELKALQDEATEKVFKGLKDSPETGAEKHEFTEVIRQKNRHIVQLLEDMEVVEEENISLRTKLTLVRDELSETTTHITEITAELAKLKHLNEEYQTQTTNSEEKIKSLNCQIEELVEEKSKNDKQLDEYILMFNTKLQEWKDEVEAKNNENLKLKEEMKKISSPRIFTSDSNERDLHYRIMQQEREIQILQQELSKATEEINSSTELIEKLKEKHLQLMSAPVHNQSFKFFEEKIKILEEKLVYAEEDAHTKAEEMSDLVIQLREYESGIFGLSEAVVRIKKLEKNLQAKDLQIEKLVEICNSLEIKLDSFEEQNMCLRERLGLSTSEEIDTSGVKLRYKKDEELFEKLKLQLDQKEEELIKAKLKYRKAVKFIKIQPTAVEKTKLADPKLAEENRELTCKLQTILKENDALRKGMHEILESIRNSSGSVEVQSTCLERLLEALDSRHISGWYHPAMRLQAQLSTEEGKNEELRNQIRSLRSEEKKIVSELQNAYLKIQSLEQDISTPRYEEVAVATPKTPDETVQKTEIDTARELRIIELESSLREFKLDLDRRKTDLERMEKTFGVEKENLLTKLTELECQNVRLKSENPDLAKISEQTSQITVLERQVNFLKNSEATCREMHDKLKQEMIEEEEKMLKEILKLQNEKSKLLTTVEKLEKDILNSVPRDKFQSLAKELANTKTKFQNAVSLALVKDEDDTSKSLQIEIGLLQDEKQALLDELRLAKEKLIVTEALVREESVTKGDFSTEVSAIAGRLAASEVRELNEKQKTSHLEKINEMLKTQQEEVECRSRELLVQVTKLTEENEKHVETERELRMKVPTRSSEEELESLENKIKSLETKCEELTTERDNIQELFEISQGQCRAFQEWKDADKILLASTNEQIMLLQSTDDDKAKISRLSHELAMNKLTTSQLAKKNNDLKMKITKLLSQKLSLELKMEENQREYHNSTKKYLTLTEYLYETIDEIRNRYGGAVPFRHAEDVYNAKSQLREKQKEAMEKAKQLKTQIHEYTIKKEEMETQLESLEDLKAGMKGDAKNLITWHNKTTELRLKEAKCRRENEFLVGEISQLENCLRKLNEEITAMEEGNIEKEKEWERKQIFWEKCQLQSCQQQDKTLKKKKTHDVSTNTETDPQKPRPDDWRLPELEAEIAKLRQEAREKDEIIIMKDKLLNNLNGKAKTIELEETVSAEKIESAEKEALRVTVESLQSIIKQKEETILRYQNLLKEGREEYGRACGKLQEELRSLNDTMAAQSKAYNKLKNAVQENQFANEAIPDVVEKYITKIHELEEEVRECEMNLSSVTAEVCAGQREVEKWRKMAEERALLVEEMKQRLSKDSEHKSETQTSKEEVTKYKKEIERLTELIELLRGEHSKGSGHEEKLMETSYFQDKILRQETSEITPKPDQLSDCTFDKPARQRKDQTLREVETLRRQLKFSKDESLRLREQIRLLQSAKPARRPKTTGSTSSRSDSRSSVKEETLTSKIRHLEELLTTSKEREKELLDINQKKLKSAEEVAKWNERKKSQQTIQNLVGKLKEKEAEVEVLRNKNESFRNMIYKCERDKVVLESQLKAAKGGPGGINAKLERLSIEKQELQTEIICLQTKLQEQMRHSGGLGAALLQEKLEEQERKLASYELASMGQTALMDELERVKAAQSSLEKANLRLESENLALQLKLEKEKAEAKYLLDKAKHYQDTTDAAKRQESDRAITHLQTIIEKLRDENKRLKAFHNETRTPGLEKIRKDLTKLREDHDLLRGKYMEAIDRNAAMEDELKSCRYQLHLMEEKDLAEALTRTTGFQTSSRLSEELIEVKAKLTHKTQLLNRVKALLAKAAAKEKALIQQIAVLQGLVPKELPRGEDTVSRACVPQEVLVNPDCPVGVIHEFLRSTFVIDKAYELDLCDESGNLCFMYDKEPWMHGLNILTPKQTYYVVLFEKDEENRVTNPLLYLPESTKKSSAQWNDLMGKIRKQLNPSLTKPSRTLKTRSNTSQVK